MSRLCLTLARLFLSLWVGGAILFVVTSIAEQKFPGFSQATKNQLALIRFPWYYRFGFTLLGGTLVAGHFARHHADLAGFARWVVFGLTAASLAVMAIDYHWVYEPLAAIVTPSDRAVSSEFERYHQLSKYVNLAHVGIALVACVILCRPARTVASREK
ncbi:MAG: hypothetical protein IT428_23775 [Planctomycetaceae bacterium]|nr:hypothetical protein [Planctomycetaceae bacterium]